MKRILFLFLALVYINLSSQIIHTVATQETVYGIAKKYRISQEKLLEYNTFVNSEGLKIGDVLIIPSVSTPKSADEYDYVKIEPKETLYNLTSTYYITEQELLRLNPSLKKGLKAGELIRIPKIKIIETASIPVIPNGMHLVKKQETVYGLTRLYSITQEDLYTLNSGIRNGELKEGQLIRVKKLKSTTVAEDKKITKQTTPEVQKPKQTTPGVQQPKQNKPEVQKSKQTTPEVQQPKQNKPEVQKPKQTIPEVQKPKQQPESGNFITHKVKKGETIYSISKLYRVTFDELLLNNPDLLINGLLEGMTLKIPSKEIVEKPIIITSLGSIKRVVDDKIDLAIILPFHTSGNKLNKQEISERNISVEFISGAKIALESLVKQGKKINLQIIDSKNNIDSIRASLNQYDFNRLDAIIGPLYSSNIRELAEILIDSNIPIVSPLANSNDLDQFDNILIATPRDETLANEIIKEVHKNYTGEEIFILTDDSNEALAIYTKDKLEMLLKTNIIVTKDINQLIQPKETISEKMGDGSMVNQTYYKPVSTILVSSNNNLGNLYVNKLKTMDANNLKGYGIKYVSAYDIYDPKNKDNIEDLKNIGFTFSALRLANINGTEERNIINAFLGEYCQAPSEYQQIGHDIVYDVIDRMNRRGDLFNNLSSQKTRLSTKFNYQKTDRSKAYINESIRIVRLSK